MKAAIFNGKGKIDVGERPDPVVQEPTDAIVHVVRSCVCGSDLWYFRGINPHEIGSIGHEFIGVIEAVGDEARELKVGQLVIAPFKYSCGRCVHCTYGVPTSCISGGSFGNGVMDGGQGEKVRVPQAAGTLVAVPENDYTDEQLASFTALSDVMCTGHHAAICASVRPGSTVAVVGDGAVGLSAVLAAKRLGASRIIALSRYPSRQTLAREFGATDIVAERGDQAAEMIKELTNSIGVDAALECVGSDEAMQTAIYATRPGGSVGFVGLPHDVEIPIHHLLRENIGLRGGIAPAREYIPELLQEVVAGTINPGRVFDFATDLDHVSEAYEAMDERRAIKSLLRVSEI